MGGLHELNFYPSNDVNALHAQQKKNKQIRQINDAIVTARIHVRVSFIIVCSLICTQQCKKVFEFFEKKINERIQDVFDYQT